MLGEDSFHYSVEQRVTGDLMIRDLILLNNQRLLLDHLSTSGPIKVLIPSCVVPGGGELLIAHFEPFGAIAVAQCRLEVSRLYTALEVDPANYQIKVLNAAGDVLFSTATGTNSPWVPVVDDLTEIAASGIFRVVLVNSSPNPVAMSGTLIISTPPLP